MDKETEARHIEEEPKEEPIEIEDFDEEPMEDEDVQEQQQGGQEGANDPDDGNDSNNSNSDDDDDGSHGGDEGEGDNEDDDRRAVLLAEGWTIELHYDLKGDDYYHMKLVTLVRHFHPRGIVQYRTEHWTHPSYIRFYETKVYIREGSQCASSTVPS